MNPFVSETIRSRAPVRVDLAGGWTDVADFALDTPGAVVNVSIDLWSYVTLKTCPVDEGIKIFSADFEEYVTAKDIQQLEYGGQIDLVKAAAQMLNMRAGVSIQTRSDAPPGSGLGTSAAMGVALVGALGLLQRRSFLDFEVAEMASNIERVKLGIRGGKQDHYASALGGLNFMEFFGETVRTARIPVSPATQMYLEKHLVLVYTGKSRLSGDIHGHVWSAFKNGHRSTVEAIEEMKKIARQMKDDLIAAHPERLAGLLNENWHCQKALHPNITNPDFDQLFELALKSGAAGGKACGAGGGGCVLFIAKPESEHTLRRAIEKVPGLTILPMIFESRGLEVATYQTDSDTK